MLEISSALFGTGSCQARVLLLPIQMPKRGNTILEESHQPSVYTPGIGQPGIKDCRKHHAELQKHRPNTSGNIMITPPFKGRGV